MRLHRWSWLAFSLLAVSLPAQWHRSPDNGHLYALTAKLDERQAKGKLVYGLHASKAALMTCLIFNRQGEHVHFVDGADGGYALASAQMKEKLGAGPLH